MPTPAPPAETHAFEVAQLPAPITLTPRGDARHEFMACVLPGVWERKVLNLIQETHAKLQKFSDDRVLFQVGDSLLFLRNKPLAAVQVEVSLTLHRDTPCPISMTHVVVDIRPQDPVSSAVFQQRCRHVVRAIHACFMGHPLRQDI